VLRRATLTPNLPTIASKTILVGLGIALTAAWVPGARMNYLAVRRVCVAADSGRWIRSELGYYREIWLTLTGGTRFRAIIAALPAGLDLVIGDRLAARVDLDQQSRERSARAGGIRQGARLDQANDGLRH
jgi:hypothetical protein